MIKVSEVTSRQTVTVKQVSIPIANLFTLLNQHSGTHLGIPLDAEMIVKRGESAGVLIRWNTTVPENTSSTSHTELALYDNGTIGPSEEEVEEFEEYDGDERVMVEIPIAEKTKPVDYVLPEHDEGHGG